MIEDYVVILILLGLSKDWILLKKSVTITHCNFADFINECEYNANSDQQISVFLLRRVKQSRTTLWGMPSIPCKKVPTYT